LSALTGKKYPMQRKPTSPERSEEIKRELEKDKWADLRSQLTAKNLMPKDKGPSTSISNFNVTVIDPAILNLSNGIYAAHSTEPHVLASSTLLDNCGAMHLVNQRSLLDPDSFKRTDKNEWVDAGASSFPISGYGTRTLKNALMDEQGNKTVSLTLSSVAVVEGFHVSIVSEAKLGQAGLWYLGLDCSLRTGTLEQSTLRLKLQRMYNLCFFEYNVNSSYESSDVILTSSAGVLKRTKAL
jgi:hypothetical protein